MVYLADCFVGTDYVNQGGVNSSFLQPLCRISQKVLSENLRLSQVELKGTGPPCKGENPKIDHRSARLKLNFQTFVSALNLFTLIHSDILQ